MLDGTTPTTAPIWKAVNPPLINPSFGNDAPVDEFTYPEWAACFTLS
jgi:hypothetical protein